MGLHESWPFAALRDAVGKAFFFHRSTGMWYVPHPCVILRKAVLLDVASCIYSSMIGWSVPLKASNTDV